jgi:hypothetical protein
MEGLTRLVAESLARHGFDRPLDYRRLQWSRWFRCDSHHSLLCVPSKPGVFAVAEEVLDLGTIATHVGTAAPGCPAEQSSALAATPTSFNASLYQEAAARDSISNQTPETGSRKPEAGKRMLAVTQFFEDDDMAFVLDRMLSRHNPSSQMQMTSPRLASGRYFVRFVVVQDQTQRRSICSALNQWMLSSAEKATGIGSHFATSLELTPATEYIPQPDDRQQSLFADATANREGHDFSRADTAAQILPALAAEGIVSAMPAHPPAASPQLDSGAATNLHCPTPFPSGF